MSERRGSAVPDNAVSLAINSRSGRTQNHFHIPYLLLARRCAPGWITMPPLSAADGCRFPVVCSAMNISRGESLSPSWRSATRFLMLAEEVPEAREHMGRFALAMAKQNDGSLVLLATERNLLTLNRASAEEIGTIAA